MKLEDKIDLISQIIILTLILICYTKYFIVTTDTKSAALLITGLLLMFSAVKDITKLIIKR